ncbi:MAG TPA: DUF1802 family protein [Chloroflexota bacterium]|nr:DUF1802 family protein [Chloroflexota bacterium]
MIETPVLTATHALKEWAVAIRALREGEGIVTVRKGGIREEAREFRMEQRRFVFFPTYEHQNAGQLQERYRPRLDALIDTARPGDTLRIDTWAEVTDMIEVREQAPVTALSDYYVFSQAYAIERLQWRPRKPLHVLLLRVYRLPRPIDLPMLASYGGCKSWIELPAPIGLRTGDPALDDPAFAALRARALAALQG